MSRSPSDSDAPAGAYEAGWAAVSRLIREGWSWSGHERNVAFLNPGDAGGGRFADVSAVAGLDQLDDGRAVARIDWDFDGDLDLVQSARTGPRLRVLRNDLPAGAGWITLRLAGAAPNTGAIGARVELWLEDGPRARLSATRRAGEGFLAQSSAWLHFGLGGGKPTRATVHWPNGTTEDFTGLRRGRAFVLTQGEGQARPWPAPSVPQLAAAPQGSQAAPEPGPVRLVCAVPRPVPGLVVRASGRERRIFGLSTNGLRGTGRAALLVLFSHTCAPCARELAALAEARDALRAAGLDVVALSVDPVEEAAAIGALIERTGLPGTVAFLDPESAATLDALVGILRDDYRPAPIPTSFLVDAEGRAQVVYLGPVEPQEVLDDLALAELEPDERDLAALPFRGHRAAPFVPPSLGDYARAFQRRGLADAAAEMSLASIETRQVDEAELAVGFGKARVGQERFEEAARHFEHATELDPLSVEAWKGLGYCRHRLGALPEARAAYERAGTLDPDDDRNRANLALVLIDQGELDLARAELATLVAHASPYARQIEARLEGAGR